MAITRAIPDVRSTSIAKTARFYSELLGFDLRMEDDDVAAFDSATNPGVEVTLNRDATRCRPGSPSRSIRSTLSAPCTSAVAVLVCGSSRSSRAMAGSSPFWTVGPPGHRRRVR